MLTGTKAQWFFIGNQGYDLGRGGVSYSTLFNYNGGSSFWNVNGVIYRVNKLSSVQGGGGPAFDTEAAIGNFVLGSAGGSAYMAGDFFEAGITNGITEGQAASTSYNSQAFWSSPTIHYRRSVRG
jgi:hypothetical protein